MVHIRVAGSGPGGPRAPHACACHRRESVRTRSPCGRAAAVHARTRRVGWRMMSQDYLTLASPVRSALAVAVSISDDRDGQRERSRFRWGMEGRIRFPWLGRPPWNFTVHRSLLIVHHSSCIVYPAAELKIRCTRKQVACYSSNDVACIDK